MNAPLLYLKPLGGAENQLLRVYWRACSSALKRMEDDSFSIDTFSFQPKQLLGFSQKLDFSLMIHARSLMTFLPSKADGFQFQTTLIKHKHRNEAGSYRAFGRAAPVLGLVIFGENKPCLRRQNVTNPAAE